MPDSLRGSVSYSENRSMLFNPIQGQEADRQERSQPRCFWAHASFDYRQEIGGWITTRINAVLPGHWSSNDCSRCRYSLSS